MTFEQAKEKYFSVGFTEDKIKSKSLRKGEVIGLGIYSAGVTKPQYEKLYRIFKLYEKHYKK